MPLSPRPWVTLADDPTIALGPLDGRYRPEVAPLVDHLSEAALNRARLHVEVEWVIHLCATGAIPGAPTLTGAEVDYLRGVVADFGPEQIAELGAIEAETRHDVKAVEYFLKRRMTAAATTLGEATSLPAASELVHIFCTSEDINNLSYALTIRSALQEVWLRAAGELTDAVADLARSTPGCRCSRAPTASRPPRSPSVRNSPFWPTGCGGRCGAWRAMRSSARSTAPRGRSRRTRSRSRPPIGKRWRASS